MSPSSASRLRYLPVSLFASVMGIGGLSLAWRRAARVLGAPPWPGQVLAWVALVLFAVLLSAYALKWVRHRDAVLEEWRHPIKMAFVPTITIALLIVSTAMQDLFPSVARLGWWVGAVGHLVLTITTLSAWFRRGDIVAGHITPAWFIPVVGNVVTPLAAPTLGSVEFGWFAFGVGITFWVTLLPLLVQRVITHEQPLPPKLLPTLAIFAAPPAVAMLSWQSLTGDLDGAFPRVLYAAMLGFVALVLAQWRSLKDVPFAMPSWAYTFPSAAAAAAALAVAGARPSVVHTSIAVVLMALASVVVTLVATLTVRAGVRGEIFVPE